MNLDNLLKVINAILDSDLKIYEIAYHYYSFGSWYVSFEKENNKIRLVWDGKDQWLKLQTKSAKTRDKNGWKDLWILKDKNVNDLDNLIDKISCL